MTKENEMTKGDLIEKLHKLADLNDDDPEENHMNADGLLLKFIDDEEITKAYNAIRMWYA